MVGVAFHEFGRVAGSVLGLFGVAAVIGAPGEVAVDREGGQREPGDALGFEVSEQQLESDAVRRVGSVLVVLGEAGPGLERPGVLGGWEPRVSVLQCKLTI